MIDFAALKAANAPLNAFVDWDEGAGCGAGPLAGVSVGVKANIAVAGLPWTAGTALWRERVAASDADVVKMLRSNGAAILGTLNMEEAALGAKTDNPWFGATHNPHRIGHTPGGSSGGSAAAVAAGLCDVALGTDTMGSVRIPASYCGVYGFKPAHGAISQAGLECTLPDLDTIGPLARDLDLLARTARVISRFGAGGCTRVVTLAGLGDVAVTPDVRAAHDRAAAAAGVAAVITLPHAPSRVRFAGFIAASRWLADHLAGADPALVSPGLAHLLTYGPRRGAADLAADGQVMAETAAALAALVADGTLLLLPTAPQAAFAHTQPAPANQADFTCLASIAGLPALSLPAGWSTDGLPLGVQLVAAAGREAGLFAAAAALDGQLAAYRRPAIFGS